MIIQIHLKELLSGSFVLKIVVYTWTDYVGRILMYCQLSLVNASLPESAD